MKGLITAIRTLTIIPVPGKDAEKFSSALYWFSVVGLILGGIQYGVARGFSLLTEGQWPQAGAILIVALGAFLTRAFHLDGMADFADGFWGGHDRERILAIMKDSMLGTFGVLSLILLVAAKWIVLVKILTINIPFWIIVAYIVSRCVQVELMVSLPYARKQGTAGYFVEGAGQRHRWTTHLIGLVSLYLVANWAGLVAFVLGWIFCRLFGLWCLKKVGGITGDLLGACSEGVETILLYIAVIYELML